MGRDISMREWARGKCCCLEIDRNYTGSIFTLNNEYWKRSRTKTIKGALLGGPEYLTCAIGSAETVAVSESSRIAWVEDLGKITNVGSSHARKL